MRRLVSLVLIALAACGHARPREAPPPPMERVRVADDGRGFVLMPSGRPFTPWGFNYDHDASPGARLLEDYWQSEWASVERAFREMRSMGATVVRIHLQLARFMRRADEVDPGSLERLRALLRLAAETNLRIDLTGLGGYRPSDVPAWYDALGEKARWQVQARFWEAVAGECATSPAIFAYDLMNEPAVPAEPRATWRAPPFDDGRTYVELLTRDPLGRSRSAIAREWLRTMTRAIKSHDRTHLVTVGLFFLGDRAVDLPLGLTPAELASEVDFFSAHLYPREGAIDASLRTLDDLSAGKPIVIEEVGPLRCSVSSLREFLVRSRGRAAGALGFYWGKTIEECRRSTEARDALMGGWLEVFRDLAPR